MKQYEMKKIAYQSELKNRALQVLLYLIDRSNKEQTCFPAIPTIARELHISVSTGKRQEIGVFMEKAGMCERPSGDGKMSGGGGHCDISLNFQVKDREK